MQILQRWSNKLCSWQSISRNTFKNWAYRSYWIMFLEFGSQGTFSIIFWKRLLILRIELSMSINNWKNGSPFSTRADSTMLRNLPRLKLNFELDFEWSFRPIILFLSFFGVDLSDDAKFNRIKRCFNHLYALIWLVIFNFGINFYYYFFSNIGNDFKLTTMYNYV